MLQQMMKTSDPQLSEPSSLQTKKSFSTSSKKSSVQQSPIPAEARAEIYDFQSHDYFTEKRKTSTNNQINVVAEYGLDKPSPKYSENHSQEDIFTNEQHSDEKENVNIDSVDKEEFSPISKVDDSQELSDDIDKVPCRESDLKKKSPKPKVTKTIKKKATINNNGFNILADITNKPKTKAKNGLKTISPFEPHSSKMNSAYLKVYATQENHKVLNPNNLKFNGLNVQLKNQNYQTKKSKKSSTKSKRASKRSPVAFKGLNKILPKLIRRGRSKSPEFLGVKAFNDLLKARRKMMDRYKRRRKSIEPVLTTKKFKSKKTKSPWGKKSKSPLSKKSPPSVNLKKRLKAKSPHVIIPPAINFKRGMLNRDNSMVILLQLNIN